MTDRHGRRRLLQGMAGLACCPVAALAGPPTGWLPVRLRPPEMRVQLAHGGQASLTALLAGRVSWVQLMFAGCNTVCPPQAALFAALAERADPQRTRLLSLSVDALGDTPASLAAWLARLHAPGHWQAGLPTMMDVGRLSHFLRGVAPSDDPTAHTAQVFVFDAQGQLAFRSGDLPAVAQLLSVQHSLA